MKTMKKKPIVVAVLLASALAGCGMRGQGCPANGTIPCDTPPSAAPHRTVNAPHTPH